MVIYPDCFLTVEKIGLASCIKAVDIVKLYAVGVKGKYHNSIAKQSSKYSKMLEPTIGLTYKERELIL